MRTPCALRTAHVNFAKMALAIICDLYLGMTAELINLFYLALI
jgi:hypothetical protein